MIFNQFFKQVVDRKIKISTEHQQKEPPYRKTLSQGQFPISILSSSTSINTNRVSPSKLCNKKINDRDPTIQCKKCQFWVHLKCNKLNLVDYKYFQGVTDPWFCLSYSILNNYVEISNKNSSVLLKPHPNLTLSLNQFNNSFPEQQVDPENVVSSRYFDTDQISLSIAV